MWTRSLLALAALVGVWAVLRLRRRLKQARGRIHPGTVALVTGASSGIGEQIALQLAARRCRLFLVARSGARLAEVAAQCRLAGAPEAIVATADITDDASCESLRCVVTKELNGALPDVLVLNAGRGAISPFGSTSESISIAKEMMDVNYFANLRLLQLFVPQLRDPAQRKETRVLIISSLAAVLPSAWRSTYCASKHALNGFCNALRQELGDKGVTITLSCPSFVQTDFHSKVAAVGGDAPQRRGTSHFMTPERCARDSLAALERGDYELVMTLSGWLGYHFRPLLPRLVDGIARRKAMGNVVADSRSDAPGPVAPIRKSE